jgi:hypothetical protein
MLLKEFLEPLGVSQVEAASRMNIPILAPQRDRQGTSWRQCRYGAAVRSLEVVSTAMANSSR